MKLETARLSYLAEGAWDLVKAAGIPKDEVAVLWGFPVHTSSVAELNPPSLVPQVTASNQFQVAVHGTVDPTTVVPFVVKQQGGSVVVMDLTFVSGPTPDLLNGLPLVDAQFVDGNIVITGSAPFVSGDTIGIFLTDAIHDVAGNPLVASPLSKLLTSQGALVDAGGNSTVSGVSNKDAATLEGGRLDLVTLFEDPSLPKLIGINRQNLVYCYAFTFEAPP